MNFSDKFIFANHTDVGKARKQNEDYMGFFESPKGNGYVFVVCDGMGGHVGGAIASQTAIKAIRYFLEQDFFQDAREAIRQSIQFANQEIYQKAQQTPDLQGMGTTCVMLVYRDGQCYIGHVGDSRMYLHRDGLLTHVTKDHSFVQMLIDQEVITEEDAAFHPRRNEILRALGTDRKVEVEVRTKPFLPQINDVLLLCSDGLNSMLQDNQIESILDEALDLQQHALRLIEKANAAGGLDNITVQLVQFLTGTTPEEATTFEAYHTKPAQSKLSDTNPLGVTTPHFSEDTLKKKDFEDTTAEEPTHKPQSHLKKRHIDDVDMVIVENSDDAGKFRQVLFQAFLGVFSAIFLYVMMQTVGQDVNFFGSRGGITADSLKAIKIQNNFYTYFWNATPELKKTKKTIDDAKQTIQELKAMKNKAKEATEQLFNPQKITQIKNQLSSNFSTEQLEALAKKYGSKLEWILKANGIKEKQDLTKLDSLFIPKTAPKNLPALTEEDNITHK